jgi:hypothetical protein
VSVNICLVFRAAEALPDDFRFQRRSFCNGQEVVVLRIRGEERKGGGEAGQGLNNIQSWREGGTGSI